MMGKLMISIRDENFRLLSDEARERGITIQELIRAVIIPDWVRVSDIVRFRGTTEDPLNTKLQREVASIYLRPKLQVASRAAGHRSSV